jgi:hypothetical protein
MNGNPRVPASPGRRSDAPIVIGAGCAQILLPGKGKSPTIALSRRASGECRFRLNARFRKGLVLEQGAVSYGDN